ncbi:maleylpyruvate isomerase family mycothiol-dependent enzyme [Nocardia bhagyanarayanae]|uniref:Uncharacterized protein (TIGR03083 family) n=1 Tax=Nocardia bhagyanarayanae TaxID=1215925 RepID=A0A543FIL2_9NOCA|nr:maleylpyruvate isomerase family mycothiol-dependent enzyme [Nocardia bhagyanarayanae]TQM33602.1 uncharacterized protein (TIGR03083 family) [Nocardia bhagyanarayanae]
MDRDQQWRVIEEQRLAVADLLDGLAPDEWLAPSLCEGWRVRDVAAHLAMTTRPPGPAAMLREAVRARGSFHRLNHDVAVRCAEEPGRDLAAELRATAASRTLPRVTNYRNIFYDVMVHGQDIAIPLGRTLELPRAAAAVAATRVWGMGWPFWARRRLKGLRLVATDCDWSVGQGLEARGGIADLLLLITGRQVVVPRLAGPGAAALVTRLPNRNPD